MKTATRSKGVKNKRNHKDINSKSPCISNKMEEKLQFMKKELAKKQKKLKKANRAAAVKAHVRSKILEQQLLSSAMDEDFDKGNSDTLNTDKESLTFSLPLSLNKDKYPTKDTNAKTKSLTDSEFFNLIGVSVDTDNPLSNSLKNNSVNIVSYHETDMSTSENSFTAFKKSDILSQEKDICTESTNSDKKSQNSQQRVESLMLDSLDGSHESSESSTRLSNRRSTQKDPQFYDSSNSSRNRSFEKSRLLRLAGNNFRRYRSLKRQNEIAIISSIFQMFVDHANSSSKQIEFELTKDFNELKHRYMNSRLELTKNLNSELKEFEIGRKSLESSEFGIVSGTVLTQKNNSGALQYFNSNSVPVQAILGVGESDKSKSALYEENIEERSPRSLSPIKQKSSLNGVEEIEDLTSCLSPIQSQLLFSPHQKADSPSIVTKVSETKTSFSIPNVSFHSTPLQETRKIIRERHFGLQNISESARALYFDDVRSVAPGPVYNEKESSPSLHHVYSDPSKPTYAALPDKTPDNKQTLNYSSNKSLHHISPCMKICKTNSTPLQILESENGHQYLDSPKFTPAKNKKHGSFQGDTIENYSKVFKFAGCFEPSNSGTIVEILCGQHEKQTFIVSVQSASLTVWIQHENDWTSELDWQLQPTVQLLSAQILENSDNKLVIVASGFEEKDLLVTVFVYEWTTENTFRFNIPLPHWDNLKHASPAKAVVLCSPRLKHEMLLGLTNETHYTLHRVSLDDMFRSVESCEKLGWKRGALTGIKLIKAQPFACLSLTTDQKLTIWNIKTRQAIRTLKISPGLPCLTSLVGAVSLKGIVLVKAMWRVDGTECGGTIAFNPVNGNMKKVSAHDIPNSSWKSFSKYFESAGNIVATSENGALCLWTRDRSHPIVYRSKGMTLCAAAFGQFLITGEIFGCLHIYTLT